MTKIVKVGGRNVTIRSFTVGQHFGTEAAARIGSRTFGCQARPYGCDLQAVQDVEVSILAWDGERGSNPA